MFSCGLGNGGGGSSSNSNMCQCKQQQQQHWQRQPLQPRQNQLHHHNDGYAQRCYRSPLGRVQRRYVAQVTRMRGLLSEQLEQSLGLMGLAGQCEACGSGGEISSCSRLFGCGQNDSTAFPISASRSEGRGADDENDECSMPSMMLSMSLANAAPLNPSQDSFTVL